MTRNVLRHSRRFDQFNLPERQHYELSKALGGANRRERQAAEDRGPEGPPQSFLKQSSHTRC